jgi:hypothetical protein
MTFKQAFAVFGVVVVEIADEALTRKIEEAITPKYP